MRSMPVLDDGVVVGIISRRDILRVMVRTDAAMLLRASRSGPRRLSRR